MALDFSKIEAEVAANTAAVQAAVTLLGQLSTEVKALSTNTSDATTQAELDKLSGQIDAGNASLTAAIAANPA